MNALYRLALTIVLSMTVGVAACGGGGEGGSSSTSPNTPESTPTPPIGPPPTPTIFDPAPTISLVVDEGAIPPVRAITSNESTLYAASEFGIHAVDKGTGAVRTIAGNLLGIDSNGWLRPLVERPDGLTLVGDALYFHSQGGRVQRIPDVTQSTAPEQVVSQIGIMDAINLEAVAADQGRVMWAGVSGDDVNVWLRDPTRGPGTTKIATVPGSAAVMVAQGGVLYLLALDSGHSDLHAISLETLAITTIADGFDWFRFGPAGLSVSDARVYWIDGQKVQSLNRATNVIETIYDGPLYPISVSADDDVASVILTSSLHSSPNPTTLVEIEVPSGTLREIARVDNIGHAVRAQGRTFWVLDGYADEVYRVSDAGGSTLLWSTAQLADAPPYGLEWITPVGDRLVAQLWAGAGLVVLDPATGATEAFELVDSSVLFEVDGADLYVADSNIGIIRLDPATVATPVEYLNPQEASGATRVNGLATSGDHLYWSSAIWSGVEHRYSYRLTRADLMGQDPLVLFETISELRGLGIVDGRLWFLCQDACGAPGWWLAWVALDGSGSPIPVLETGDSPTLQEDRGRLWIFVPSGTLTPLVEYDPITETLRDQLLSRGAGSRVATSDTWLYVGRHSRTIDREPREYSPLTGRSRELDREGPFATLWASSLHHDSTALYYSHGGIWRVDE